MGYKTMALVLQTFSVKVNGIDEPRIFTEGQIVQIKKSILPEYVKRGWIIPCSFCVRDNDIIIVRAMQGLKAAQRITIIPQELTITKAM